MMLMAKFSLPLVWLLDRSGKLLLRLLGQRGDAEDRISEDEIKTLWSRPKTPAAGARRKGNDRRVMRLATSRSAP